MFIVAMFVDMSTTRSTAAGAWLTTALALDHERARGWALAQTIAWSDGGRLERCVEVARWLQGAR